MNIPTYQKKDYSYLSNAFGQLSKGLGGVASGIKNIQDVEAGERKRQQEMEKQARLKLSREDTEKVRENLLAETAVLIHEARGYANDKSGFDKALTEASRIIYRPTMSEWENGTAVSRFLKQESTDVPNYIKKINEKKFRQEYQKGQIQEPLPPLPEYTAPQGKVGVEDRGEVKQPLSAFPQSVEGMQQAEMQNYLTGPRQLETVSTEMTPWNAYNRLIELGLHDSKEARELVEQIGKKSVTDVPRPDDAYQGPVMREVESLPLPTESGRKYAKTYQKKPTALEEKKLEIERTKANKPPAGVQTQTDKNILRLQGDLADLKQAKRDMIPKMTQVRALAYKLQKGEKPSLEERLLAETSGVKNPENPNAQEVLKLYYRLQGEMEGIDDDIKTANTTLNALYEGEPLPKAAKRPIIEKLYTESTAQEWIANNLQSLPKGVSSDLVLLNTPPAQKKALQEKVDNAIAHGVSKQAMGAWLLGRTKK